MSKPWFPSWVLVLLVVLAGIVRSSFPPMMNQSASALAYSSEETGSDALQAGLSPAEWARVRERLTQSIGATPIARYTADYYAYLPIMIQELIYMQVARLTASHGGALFGESVSISGDTLVVGDSWAWPGGPSNGAVYVFERDLGGPGNWGEAAILQASDGQEEDYFGESVAISGDMIVVGAYNEGGGPGDPLPWSGAVYVFERDLGGPGTWGEAAILRASDAQAHDRFGSSVSVSGDTILVGALYESGGPGDPNPGSGAVYVFERDLGGLGDWGEAAIVHASDAQMSDGFGWSVAVSGDTMVVGAYNEDGGPGDLWPEAGAAYVFERDMGGPGNWGEATILHASDAQAYDGFGWSVAISGDKVFVGSPGEDGGSGDPLPATGAVYVFERDLEGAGTWSERSILHASDAQELDFLGQSVAISGDTLVIGAGANWPEAGAAYVFERDLVEPGSWNETAILHAGDVDGFGESVAISGDTIIVGSPDDPFTGAAYIFAPYESLAEP